MIKIDMDMPSCCCDCIMRTNNYDDYGCIIDMFCQITDSLIDNKSYEKRPDDCPLIEESEV